LLALQYETRDGLESESGRMLESNALLYQILKFAMQNHFIVLKQSACVMAIHELKDTHIYPAV
jgi:hypothetical protein